MLGLLAAGRRRGGAGDEPVAGPGEATTTRGGMRRGEEDELVLAGRPAGEGGEPGKRRAAARGRAACAGEEVEQGEEGAADRKSVV